MAMNKKQINQRRRLRRFAKKRLRERRKRKPDKKFRCPMCRADIVKALQECARLCGSKIGAKRRVRKHDQAKEAHMK